MNKAEIGLPLIVLVLLAIGLLALSTAAENVDFVYKQAGFALAGLLAAVAILIIGRKRIVDLAFPIYWLSIVLLFLTRFIGAEKNGAKSWLEIGPLPSFQPSELAKITLVIVLAIVLHEKPIKQIKDYFVAIVLVFLPFVLVLLEPDLGSALVMAAIGAGTLLVRGIPWKHLVVFVALFAVLVPLAWPKLKPHQKTRIIAFINPEADPQGSGYQVIQSRIAIGSGGVYGKGYKKGTQAQLGFIPYRYADFIFPVIAEEGGFVAAFGLILIYLLLFWRLASMAAECLFERDQFIITGILIFISFQVLVNIGVSLGLAPVTGITLPLISYGGTSLVSTILAFALAYVVHRDRYKDY